MDIDDSSERFGTAPKRIESRCGNLFVTDHRRHHCAAKAELVDSVRQLLGGEIGMLQRHGTEPDQAVRPHGDLFGHLLVEHAYHPLGKLRLGPVVLMLEVQRQHLNVDGLTIHRRKPLGHAREAGGHWRTKKCADIGFGLRISLQQRPHLRNEQVCVHVDCAYTST